MYVRSSRRIYQLIATSIFFSVLVASCGGGGGSGSNGSASLPSNSSSSSVASSSQSSLLNGTLALFAGHAGGSGNMEGSINTARFGGPTGIAMDAGGNLYVTESCKIRKVAVTGVVSTFAGSVCGYADGTGVNAQFDQLKGIVIDASGSLYVVDSYFSVIRKITAAGVVTTLAGSATDSGSADGIGSSARFRYPAGIAIDMAGNLYVTDSLNNNIRKISGGGVVTTLTGLTDGSGIPPQFNNPTGIALDAVGNIYVCDSGNSTIRKITPAGTVTTLAGAVAQSGSADGIGADARFTLPTGVTLDAAGNLYVADRWTIRKISPAGTVTTLAGLAMQDGYADGAGGLARFRSPSGITSDAAGNLYVADFLNYAIRKITSTGTVTTVAGSPPYSGLLDGPGPDAKFYDPVGIVSDGAGNLYVADGSNSVIRKVTQSGYVSTVAGGGDPRSDGSAAPAGFSYPFGIAIDKSGNLYVADYGNYTIRKVTQAGVITTLAGSPFQYGSTDGIGGDARFAFPIGLTVDNDNNVYVIESAAYAVRKITASGLVTTFAGSMTGRGSADGAGINASFGAPSGITIDAAGNLYVADGGSGGNCTIRKITSTGVVSTFAGVTRQCVLTDGPLSAARFVHPASIKFDSAGNLYVTDSGTIRKISTSGDVTTIAGQEGIFGYVPGSLPGIIPGVADIAVFGNTLYFTGDNAVFTIAPIQ